MTALSSLSLTFCLSLVAAAAGGEATAPASAPPVPAALLDVSWGDGLYTGRIARIDVKAPQPMTSLTGSFDGHDAVTLAASSDGKAWVALVPVGIETRKKALPLALDATLVDGSRVQWNKPAPIVKAPYDERTITVSKQFMSPSKKQRERAAKEAKEMEQALSTSSTERLWRGSFAKPTPGEETSPFGTRRTYNDKRKTRHFGWDLDGNVGDPISATNRGKVVLAANRFYSGGTVIIDHGNRMFTMYFHMSRIDVQAGWLVEKGQPLGAVGASGQVTGPHLHFSVKLDGIYQDPKYLLAIDLSSDALDTGPPVAAVPPSAAPVNLAKP